MPAYNTVTGNDSDDRAGVFEHYKLVLPAYVVFGAEAEMRLVDRDKRVGRTQMLMSDHLIARNL